MKHMYMYMYMRGERGVGSGSQQVTGIDAHTCTNWTLLWNLKSHVSVSAA